MWINCGSPRGLPPPHSFSNSLSVPFTPSSSKSPLSPRRPPGNDHFSGETNLGPLLSSKHSTVLGWQRHMTPRPTRGLAKVELGSGGWGRKLVVGETGQTFIPADQKQLHGTREYPTEQNKQVHHSKWSEWEAMISFHLCSHFDFYHFIIT